MSQRTLPEALQHAVYELLTVRPHVAPDERLTYEQLLVYQRGYHAAIVRALAVMESAVRREALKMRAPTKLVRRKGAA